MAVPPSIQGEAVPPPINEVTALGLHQNLINAVRQRGLTAPMSLQKYVWPIVIRGRNIVCASKTNSGKTMGYLLPLLNSVIDKYEQAKVDGNDEYGPIALILVSSPKTAQHIGKVCSLLVSSWADLKCVVLHPEKSECEVYCQLLNGCSILVATPQAFLKALLVPQSRQYTFTNLRRISHLVIDEAEMLLSNCNGSITQILSEIGLAMSVCEIEGLPSNGIQFIVTSSEWSKEVEEFYHSLLQYQPILLRGAGCKEK